MFTLWWFWWIVLMFIVLVIPTGYGWGYRGWGAPYPRFIQRRRALRAGARVPPMQFDHHAWGVGGDLIWLVVVVAVMWAFWAMWWPTSAMWWRT